MEDFPAVERLIALAGRTHVESYSRTTKSGKVVKVEAHTRSVSSMGNKDLWSEFQSLQGKSDTQSRTRHQQITTEIRKRQANGSWDKADPRDAKSPSPKGSAPEEAPSTVKARLRKALGRDPKGTNNEKPETRQAMDTVDQAAAAASSRILAKANEAEKTVSPTVKAVLDSVGGEFFGFDNRLKEDGSLRRKLKDRITGKYADEDDPAAKAEAGIGDALRYTAISSADKNIEMSQKIVDELKKAGHELVEQDNAWGDGGAYYGINMNFRAPNGLTWEMQVHTPESMERKDRSHFWYDFMRDKTLPKSVREEAAKRSSDSWVGLERPKGWENFGDLRPGESPTSDARVRQSDGVEAPEHTIPPEVSPGGEVVWGGAKFRKRPDKTWEYIGKA